MVRGAPALGTQQLQVLLAEQGQGLVVLLTQGPRFLPFPPAPPGRKLHRYGRHVGQLRVPLEVPVTAVVEADGTGEHVLQTCPALGDAGETEVVATVDGHWVSQVIQAAGAAGLLLEVS